MDKIQNLLNQISHRPFEIPLGNWQYYQEWNKAIFLHWKVSYDLLRPLVPEKLIIDNFNGDCYVSVVAFSMQKIRPKYLPPVKFISDFHEINTRTYIDNDNKKGVYFLNIEAEKQLSAYIAKALSGLPYEKSKIQRGEKLYSSKNKKKDYFLEIDFETGEELEEKSKLDNWLTERYCLYLDQDDKFFRYDIHHKEWSLQTIDIKNLQLNYNLGKIKINSSPDLVHYSEGVEVISWKKCSLL